MKRIILLSTVALLFNSQTILNAQTLIGITVITDESSNTDKAFVLSEIIIQKGYNSEAGPLQPQLVDYVYNTPYALSGKITKMMANFTIYKDGKAVDQFTCENKWDFILQSLDAAFSKLGFNTPVSKLKIDEGDSEKVYEKKMSDNLPGKMTFELPKSIYSEEFKTNALVEFFNSKNAYKELKELHGKYNNAEIDDTKFFKSKDIPAELKEAIKPLAYPIGKTMLLPSLYTAYGNLLIENKDYAAALHCFLQAIAVTNELIGSPKDKANFRAYAFAKLATLQNNISPNRVLLAKLFNACAALNKTAKFSDQINTENATYYDNVRQVRDICIKAEQNAKSAKSARFGAFMGAVTSGVGQGLMSSYTAADYSSLSSSVQMMQVTMDKSIEQLNENMRFKEELRTVSMDIKSDAFITDAGGAENSNYFLAGEVIYFLAHYPDDVKDMLDEFAADKPGLTKLLSDFYNAATKSDKRKVLKELFKHLSKMEYTIVNFETRSMTVPDKYISEF